MTDRQRGMIEEWTKKLLWALIVALVSYGVNEIKSISQSLQNLNITVTILSEKLNTASENSKEYKARMDTLERLVFNLEKEIISCEKKK
ncbi:MAG TPA: hypothetical protein DCS19_09580 [Flavobacterium sp.]|nr:hypothetical protein [Flavobacterium sp.]